MEKPGQPMKPIEMTKIFSLLLRHESGSGAHVPA
jgi:hypothetical protein